MEVWNKWSPIEQCTAKGAIECINDEEAITLSIQQKANSLVVRYRGGVFSYQVTAASAFLKKIEFLKKCKKLNVSIEEGCFFKVENSEYLEWVNEESDGIYEYYPYSIEHFVYVGSNVVVEVLATSEPEIILTE